MQKRTLDTRFVGTGVALVTPFLSNGKVDFASLKKLTHHIINGKCEYLALLGTTSENVTISLDDKKAIIETILVENNNRVPIMLGCGGNDTQSIAKDMQFYQKIYAFDAFLSVSPYYNRPTQNGMFEHYRYLSTVSEKPIVLYNVPIRTGSNMLPETVIRIANECANVIGIKDASGNIEQGMAMAVDCPDDFLLLSGDDKIAIAHIAIGYKGVISVSGNALPFETSEIIRAALKNDYETARKYHFLIQKFIDLLFVEGNPAGIKAALSILKICEPFTRLPLVPASSELCKKIEIELNKILK